MLHIYANDWVIRLVHADYNKQTEHLGIDRSNEQDTDKKFELF